MLVAVNSQFLEELETRFASNETPCIGDIFLKLKDLFKVYSQYANLYSNACEMLKRLKKKNMRFSDFLKEVYRHPDTESLQLEDFLIMPVQRTIK